VADVAIVSGRGIADFAGAEGTRIQMSAAVKGHV
jgi:hypothetical protein